MIVKIPSNRSFTGTSVSVLKEGHSLACMCSGMLLIYLAVHVILKLLSLNFEVLHRVKPPALLTHHVHCICDLNSGRSCLPLVASPSHSCGRPPKEEQDSCGKPSQISLLILWALPATQKREGELWGEAVSFVWHILCSFKSCVQARLPCSFPPFTPAFSDGSVGMEVSEWTRVLPVTLLVLR